MANCMLSCLAILPQNSCRCTFTLVCFFHLIVFSCQILKLFSVRTCLLLLTEITSALLSVWHTMKSQSVHDDQPNKWIEISGYAREHGVRDFWEERVVPSGLENSLLYPPSPKLQPFGHLILTEPVRSFDVTVVIYIWITCNVILG